MLTNKYRYCVIGVVMCMAVGFLPFSPSAHASSGASVDQGQDNTFSIVGRCARTGDFAVVVSTARLGVGNRVPWAASGVGAIATQASTNTELGREGLKLLAAGATAQEALDKVLAADAGRDTRQLSIIDAKGGMAVHTGKTTGEKSLWAGSIKGKDCVAAGNLLVSEETVQAMVKAFEETEGFIGERVMKALEAGQAAGGDKRGKISAAMLVVRTGPHPLLDLRIDSSDDPVAELRKLYDAYMKAFKINQ